MSQIQSTVLASQVDLLACMNGALSNQIKDTDTRHTLVKIVTIVPIFLMSVENFLLSDKSRGRLASEMGINNLFRT